MQQKTFQEETQTEIQRQKMKFEAEKLLLAKQFDQKLRQEVEKIKKQQNDLLAKKIDEIKYLQLKELQEREKEQQNRFQQVRNRMAFEIQEIQRQKEEVARLVQQTKSRQKEEKQSQSQIKEENMVKPHTVIEQNRQNKPGLETSDSAPQKIDQINVTNQANQEKVNAQPPADVSQNVQKTRNQAQLNLAKFNQLPKREGISSPIFVKKDEVFTDLPLRSVKSAGKIIKKLFEDEEIEVKVVDLQSLFHGSGKNEKIEDSNEEEVEEEELIEEEEGESEEQLEIQNKNEEETEYEEEVVEEEGEEFEEIEEQPDKSHYAPGDDSIDID
uniref:Uncharacterized protein n=1 Tax=Trepomonas sp. PC1 TaxID=1076344 RepID=A0A146K1J5_9EUKA|eukprot:JAP89399.1 Hypothetical protein TPC1_31106 [Trepomonas sp. PC1]